MELRARTRILLRRAVPLAALGALLVPATAGADTTATASAKKKRAKAPVVRSVRPMEVAIGQTITIHGRNFRRGRKQNTVVFKRDGARAVFVKADLATAKLLKVEVPGSLAEFLAIRDASPAPTRFRIRILAKRFGKSFTKLSKSPLVSPAGRGGAAATPPADGDCDGDGMRNGVDPDDDDDLLSDSIETSIGTDPCKSDSDGDGVGDGYEYQSARELNDDEHQEPNASLPYPGKRPYPNPLFADADTDYDGDSLTLAEEQALWSYTWSTTKTDARTLAPLSYSDGEQYSRSVRGSNGRRQPTLPAAGYDKQASFLAWANASGYRTVVLEDGAPWQMGSPTGSSYGLFDIDRSGGESPAELEYFDADRDGSLSDDERDEDADGLTNYDETHGRLVPSYWNSCYSLEAPYHIAYAGTSVVDADSDGDGILDAADDQDHDDIPNVLELSRILASGHDDREPGRPCEPDKTLPKDFNHPNDYGRLNPFNPCLPATFSRTCPRYVSKSTGAPFDGSPNWFALQ